MGAKLVRDRIGDLDWKYPDAKAGLRPSHDFNEYYELLRAKLLEEVGELVSIDAKRADWTADGTSGRILEEAADVYEVLLAIVALSGHLPAEPMLKQQALARRAKAGSFTEGLVWET